MQQAFNKVYNFNTQNPLFIPFLLDFLKNVDHF